MAALGSARESRRARRARKARAASAELTAMAARVASEESVIIHIRVAHGDDLVKYVWRSNDSFNSELYIEFFKSEWKDSDGKPWTELPGEKNIKWVDVQTVLRKLAVFEKPAYLIFCRTNELLPDHTFKKRKAGNPYEIMPPIRVIDDKQYFYLETHGKHRAIDFDALPEYYRRPGTFYYRAPPGRICSQYGLEYGYIPYDYTMSCFMSGVKSDTNPTNDLLLHKLVYLNQ